MINYDKTWYVLHNTCFLNSTTWHWCGTPDKSVDISLNVSCSSLLNMLKVLIE